MSDFIKSVVVFLEINKINVKNNEQTEFVWEYCANILHDIANTHTQTYTSYLIKACLNAVALCYEVNMQQGHLLCFSPVQLILSGGP